MRLILLFLYFHFSSFIHAQKIAGTVFDHNNKIIPFASILVKGTTQGTTANTQGKFSYTLSPGKYTVICQHVGYAKQEKTVTIVDQDIEMVFFLTEQKLQLKEIVVKSNAEDPAYAIIRAAIKKRPGYNKQVKAFTVEAYIKGIMKLRQLPKKIFGRKIPDDDKKEMGVDSTGKGIIYLSESITKVAMQEPNKVKLEVISGRESGSNGFGFNFPTFISLYENNVTVFTSRINPRGFVSPIADGAMNFYRYKYLGSFWEEGKEINSIRVMPKRNFEPLFSGIINITEGDWRIHSCNLVLTKTAQLEILDTLTISQIHVPVTQDIWRVKNQVVHFNFKQFGIDAIGDFVNVYSRYNLDPKFEKNYFDRVIIKYDTSVNKKTKAYWDTIRPIPLEPEESKDYQVKDSIYQNRKDSLYTKNNLDSMKRRQGSLKPTQLLWSGVNRTHYDSANLFRYSVEPLIKNIEYNTVEGIALNLHAGYYKYLKSWKTNLAISPHIRYGTNNHHLNAYADIVFRTRDWNIDKKLKRETWRFSGGTRVSQFNKESTITPLSNSIGTLFFGRNYMKIYENSFGNINYQKRLESGFAFSIDALYENRMPLDNTTDFVFFKKDTLRLTPNYPFEKIPVQFTPHQAVIVAVNISFKPGQRYIQFPRNKMAIGSDYPTFALNFTKGIKDIAGSDVNFDKWKFSVYDDVNLKLAGTFKYKFSIGGFLNDKKVFIQDFQHFNGNQSLVAREFVNSFQLAPYYANSTTSSFYSLAHVEHHFNGLLTNKIPLFKRLNWNLVGGSNAFYVNKDNNYLELFAGLENIFKLFRVDLVTGSVNGAKPTLDVVIGFGGIIGGNARASQGGRNIEVSF
ncbi:MAG: DUF5686 and carboxypeptidase regulatory-like domain-containing protein [Chitinophagaceae bacterium]